MEKIEYTIAKLVNELGGKTYYVGGFVRDEIRGYENKDVDIEIHGIKPNECNMSQMTMWNCHY